MANTLAVVTGGSHLPQDQTGGRDLTKVELRNGGRGAPALQLTAFAGRALH